MALSTITSGVETAATSAKVGDSLVITGNGFASNKPVAITTTVGTTVISYFTSASQNNCVAAFTSNIGGIGTANSLYTGSGATACLTTTASGSFKTTVTVPPMPGGAQTITVADGTNTGTTAITITQSVTFTRTAGNNNFGFPEEGVIATITPTGFGASETVTVSTPMFATTSYTCTTGTTGSCPAIAATFVVADITGGAKTITATGATSGLTASATYTVNPWASFYNSAGGVTSFSFLGSAPTSLLVEAHGLPAGTIAASSITVGGVTTNHASITVGSSGAIFGVVVSPASNVPFGTASVVIAGTTFSYAAGNIASAGITPGAVVASGNAPWGGALVASIAGAGAAGTGVVITDATNYKPGTVVTASTTNPAPAQNQIAFFGYGFVSGGLVTITAAAGAPLGGTLTQTPGGNGAFFIKATLGDTPWSVSATPTVAAAYSPTVTQTGGPANILSPTFGITPWIDTSKSSIGATTVDATTATETFISHGFGATDVLTATVGGSSMVSGGTCTAALGTCTTAVGKVPDLASGKQNVAVAGSVSGQTATATGAVTYDPIATFYSVTPSTALSIVAGPSGSTTILRTSTGANIFGVHGLAANTAYTVVWNGMGSTQSIGTFTSTATGGIPVPGVQVTLPSDVAGIHAIDIAPTATPTTSALYAGTLVGDLSLSDSADTTNLGATYATGYGDVLFNLGTSLIASPTVANVGQSVVLSGNGLAANTMYDLGVSLGGIGTGTTPTTCALSGTGAASPPTIIVGAFTSTAAGAVPAATALALTDTPSVSGLEQGTLYCAYAQTGANFGTTVTVGTAQFLLASSASLNMSSAPIGHNVIISAHGLAANKGYNVLFAPYTNPGTSSFAGTVVGAVLTNINGAGSATLTVPATVQSATGSVAVQSGTTYTIQLQPTGGSTVALAAPPSLNVGSVSVGCNSTSCLSSPSAPTQGHQGVFNVIQASYTNTSNSPVTTVVYAVCHNQAGQTVSVSTGTITIPASGSATAYPALSTLPAGTYSCSVFAVSTSGTAISTSSTASVTI